MKSTFATFEFELPLWEKDTYVIGIDEVGRGCMAGPITVAGVCLGLISKNDQAYWQQLQIHDSKKVTEKKREKLAPIIQEKSLCYSIHSSSVEMINKDGIVPAFHYAVHNIMTDIQAQLPRTAKLIAFVDAFTIPNLNIPQQAIVKGDQKSISIAAASIIAKVHRDSLMESLSTEENYKYYCWNENKGYGTLKHRQAITQYGPSNLHRTLYIRNIVTTV